MTAEETGKWISVKKSLPKLERKVDISIRGFRLTDYARVYDPSAEGWLWVCVDDSIHDGEPLEALGYADNGPEEVTHWMPIPKPPKGKPR